MVPLLFIFFNHALLRKPLPLLFLIASDIWNFPHFTSADTYSDLLTFGHLILFLLLGFMGT